MGDIPELINICGGFFFCHKTSFQFLLAWWDDTFCPCRSKQHAQPPKVAQTLYKVNHLGQELMVVHFFPGKTTKGEFTHWYFNSTDIKSLFLWSFWVSLRYTSIYCLEKVNFPDLVSTSSVRVVLKEFLTNCTRFVSRSSIRFRMPSIFLNLLRCSQSWLVKPLMHQ